MLNLLTVTVNLIALALSLWLGLYIVTRTPRRQLSWLTAGTIWAMSLFHLYNILVIYPPLWAGWTSVRPLAVLGLPLWVHASVLLRNEVAPFSGPRKFVSVALVTITYLTAAALAFLDVFSAKPGSEAGAHYPLLLLIVAGATLYFAHNLWQCYRQARHNSLRRIFALLLAGTVTTALGGMLRGLTVLALIAIPTVIGDVVMSAAVIAIGYAIARYDAFLVGQTINRDLLYSLTGVGLATALLDALIVLGLQGQVTMLALVLTTSGAIVTHALYDGVRSMLDRLFYHGQLRSLRINLRALASHSGRAQPIEEHLHALLVVIGDIFRIPNGYLALRQPDGTFAVKAQIGNPGNATTFAAATLTTNSLITLADDNQAHPFTQLLAPLFAEESQIGALVLGPSEPWRLYSEDDLTLIEDLADQLASVVNELARQSASVALIGSLAGKMRHRQQTLLDQSLRLHHSVPAQGSAEPAAAWSAWEGPIEECLRKLDDFAFLGEQALSGLTAVKAALGNDADHAPAPALRGKALREILLAAIETLRPDGAEPTRHAVTPRAWQPYIALVDPYVRNCLTREAWLRLDVSEKTFHRIRGRAIRAVAKTLYEQEQRALATQRHQLDWVSKTPNGFSEWQFAKMTVVDSLRPCADSLSALS